MWSIVLYDSDGYITIYCKNALRSNGFQESPDKKYWWRNDAENQYTAYICI